MGFVIGMDEAGYGPNLGPLVLTATVWEVPGRWPKKTDFWKAFEPIAQREVARRKKSAAKKAGETPAAEEFDEPPFTDDRLHIADSKSVYCPATGLGALERGALAAFGVASRVPSDFDQLLDDLWDNGTDGGLFSAESGRGRDLWFSDNVALPLPVSDEGAGPPLRPRNGGKFATTPASGCGRSAAMLSPPAAGTWPRAKPTTRPPPSRGCTCNCFAASGIPRHRARRW